MKKQFLSAVLAGVMMISLTGCTVSYEIPAPSENAQTQEAVAVEGAEKTTQDANAEDNIAGMANPIVEVYGDYDLEDQLGLKWDTSYLPGDPKCRVYSIIGGTLAEVRFTVANVNGDDVECRLRATKDDEAAKNPVESIAGIYDQNMDETVTDDYPVGDGVITMSRTNAKTEGIGIAYWDYDGWHYTFTGGKDMSQMQLSEIYDSIMLTIGAATMQEASEVTGKLVEPLPETVDVDNIEDAIYPVRINNSETDENGTVCDFTIYTMDLYDAVDITTLAPGDGIVVNGETIIVNRINESSVEYDHGTDEEMGPQGVIIVNGGIEYGGAEFISYGGGTFRYFGMNDHSTYSEHGNVTMKIADDAIIVDHAHDYDGGDNTEEGIAVKSDEFSKYYYEDPISYFEFNTVAHIVNNEVKELTRNYIP